MLQIVVPGGELWDEKNEQFLYSKDTILKLEHSLISISNWESKWCIPFLESDKSAEQLLDYIKCMTLNKDVDPLVYNRLTGDNIRAINEYIQAPMTASKITEDPHSKRSTEFVTSELIYYWMTVYNIPVQFEKWHINRLIMLIRICSEKNKPEKKMSQAEIKARHRAINAQRRAAAKAKRK